jgi:hypothetical protein
LTDWSRHRVRLTVTLESVLGLAAIGGLELALWRSGGVASLDPYLYWAFVLLQSVRRGLRVGLVVALLAAAAYAALVVATLGGLPSNIDDLAVDSILVVLIASITGELREQWRRREALLIARADALSDTLDELAKRYSRATEVVAEMGRRVADQTVTVAALDKIARHLAGLDPAEVFPALLELLVLCLKVDQASVYMLQDGCLIPTAHVPRTESAPAAQLVMANDVVRRALADRAPRHVRDELARGAQVQMAPAPVLMAAPVLDSLGAPMAIVTVEKLPFLSFNRSAVRLFGILVAWASRSLHTARVVEQLAAHRARDDNGSMLGNQQQLPQRGAVYQQV